MFKFKLFFVVATLASIAIVGTACQAGPPQVQAQTEDQSPAATTTASATTTAPTVKYVGKFSLNPAHGLPGSTVNASGTGFQPNSSLDLVWQAFKGAWKVSDGSYNGREFTPEMKPLTEVKTDSNGSFQASFTVPSGFGFDHDVRVENQNVVENQSNFSVDMQASISPSSGPPGTPITINLNGVGQQPLYNSWQVEYDNKITGWMSSVTTGGIASATIPAVGAPGKHVIRIVQGGHTFPYLNRQQAPQPDCPTWVFEFTVTDGQVVLPPPGESQGFGIEQQTPLTSTGSPAVWTDVASAPIDTPAVLNGTGLPAGKTLDLLWFHMTGSRVTAQGYQETSVPLGTVTVDQNGKIAFAFKVPDDLGGSHRIELDLAGQKIAETSMIITPSAFDIEPASGPIGTTITFHLKGVGWTQTANIYTVVYDNAYIGYVCGFNSQGDVVSYIPDSGQPGWHFIDLYPGIYEGTDMKYTNNFLLPQLTALQDHPGEHLPIFHFAFQVTP